MEQGCNIKDLNLIYIYITYSPAHLVAPKAYTEAALGLWVTRASSKTQRTIVNLWQQYQDFKNIISLMYYAKK